MLRSCHRAIFLHLLRFFLYVATASERFVMTTADLRRSSRRQGVHMQIWSSLFGAIHCEMWASNLARLFTQFSEKFRVKHYVFFLHTYSDNCNQAFFFFLLDEVSKLFS